MHCANMASMELSNKLDAFVVCLVVCFRAYPTVVARTEHTCHRGGTERYVREAAHYSCRELRNSRGSPRRERFDENKTNKSKENKVLLTFFCFRPASWNYDNKINAWCVMVVTFKVFFMSYCLQSEPCNDGVPSGIFVNTDRL